MRARRSPASSATIPTRSCRPPKTKKTVSAAEADILRRWIAEGAEYKGHWAFEPVEARRPSHREKSRGRQKTRSTASFSPKSTARASPPRPRPIPPPSSPPFPRPDRVASGTGEVESFRAEHRADPDKSVETLADELLASPHYASAGHATGSTRPATPIRTATPSTATRTQWPWRDWVIRSLNGDLPFDRFTIEQIAGDLLPGAGTSQLVHRRSTATP